MKNAFIFFGVLYLAGIICGIFYISQNVAIGIIITISCVISAILFFGLADYIERVNERFAILEEKCGINNEIILKEVVEEETVKTQQIPTKND